MELEAANTALKAANTALQAALTAETAARQAGDADTEPPARTFLVHGEEPHSAFEELPARFGDDSPEGVTRRTLLVGGASVAPNTFALGIDSEREVMVVHRLVAEQEGK